MQVLSGLGWTEHIQTSGGVNAGGVDVAFEHAHAVVVFQRANAVDAQFGADREMIDVAFEFARPQQEAQERRDEDERHGAHDAGGHQRPGADRGHAPVGSVGRGDECVPDLRTLRRDQKSSDEMALNIHRRHGGADSSFRMTS